jgi:hypothetical protein
MFAWLFGGSNEEAEPELTPAEIVQIAHDLAADASTRSWDEGRRATPDELAEMYAFEGAADAARAAR